MLRYWCRNCKMRWIYFHHKKYWIHTNTLHNICISIARLVKTKDKMILLHIYSNYDRLLENVYISLGTLNWIFVIHKIYSKISILFSILNIIRKYSNAFYLKGFSKKKTLWLIIKFTYFNGLLSFVDNKTDFIEPTLVV